MTTPKISVHQIASLRVTERNNFSDFSTTTITAFDDRGNPLVAFECFGPRGGLRVEDDNRLRETEAPREAVAEPDDEDGIPF